MTAYQIHPTGIGKNQENLYTDASLSALFNIFAEQINSTRAVLWQRYTAMLLANSFFSGLLIGATVDQRVMGAAAGIVLCSFWILMFGLDWWTFHYNRLAVAARFEWTDLPSEVNPFKAMMKEKRGLVIYSLAICVPLPFLIINSIILYKSYT